MRLCKRSIDFLSTNSQVRSYAHDYLAFAAVMPLASPIGSGRGLKLRHAIEIMVEQAEVPVIVDAGLGAPSQAAECRAAQ